MSDKEIIQTLEKCSSSSCDDCYYCKSGIPCLNLYRQALDLIKRQQEEIKRLKSHIEKCNKNFNEIFPREMIEKTKEMVRANNG